jgi:hypothetical protein
MTTHGTRIQAHGLLVAHGIPEERAETILRAFTAADLDIVKRAPAEPVTGPRSADPNPHVDRLREIVRAATKPTEYEETPDA